MKFRSFFKLSLITIVGLLFMSSFFAMKVHASTTYTVTNTNDSGGGSLRQAILDSNANTGSTSVIDFNVGSGLIQIIPTSPLPPITNPVLIDGTSQSGYNGTPIVEISGNGAGANAIGLYVTGPGSGSIVKGLIINQFSAQGIFIDTSNVTIENNYIGTDPTGTIAEGNAGGGIGIFSGTTLASANNNIIGGTSPSTGNLVSGNGQNGIVVNAQNGGNASNNVIEGNFVGTNSAGTGGIGNAADGILINDAGSGTITGTVIGGTSGVSPGGSCTGACNLVSSNGNLKKDLNFIPSP